MSLNPQLTRRNALKVTAAATVVAMTPAIGAAMVAPEATTASSAMNALRTPLNVDEQIAFLAHKIEEQLERRDAVDIQLENLHWPYYAITVEDHLSRNTHAATFEYLQEIDRAIHSARRELIALSPVDIEIAHLQQRILAASEQKLGGDAFLKQIGVA